MKRLLLISLSALFLLVSCDIKKRMVDAAEDYLLRTVDHPDGMAITAVSEPDSAFGVNYRSQHEVNRMTMLMQQVTQVIMSRTNGMQEFNPEDRYVMDLAERQMRAMVDLRAMVYKVNEKGEWSGWKLCVDYETDDGNGIRRRAERWFFFDKDGKDILRSFELPLP